MHLQELQPTVHIISDRGSRDMHDRLAYCLRRQHMLLVASDSTLPAEGSLSK